MSTDPCLDAALAFVRSKFLVTNGERFLSSLRIMQRNLWSGAADNELRILGLRSLDLVDLPPEKAFFEIGGRLHLVVDPSIKVALAGAIFGRGAVEALFVLRHPRPSLLQRVWWWYKRVTGYEKAALQRSTGLKIQSTARAGEVVR